MGLFGCQESERKTLHNLIPIFVTVFLENYERVWCSSGGPTKTAQLFQVFSLPSPDRHSTE